MRDPLRAKLNIIIVAALAFAFGLGLASALDFTPISIASNSRPAPKLTIGSPFGLDAADPSAGFADVVEMIAPTVVTIYVEQQVTTDRNRPRFPNPFDEFFQDPEEQDGENRSYFRQGSGSGFIISQDGYIVTNNHVVEGASRVDIELTDRRRFDDVEVVGRDPQTDVALLKINATGLPAAPLGSADDTRVGEWVLAIGSPGFSGIAGNNLPTTVTAGIVSAKGRSISILGNRYTAQQLPNLSIEDFIQTDAAINPGNSGGPLINARGEVVGVNSAIASESGYYQGYGFAVPMELVREVIDDLIEFGSVRRAVIGVSIGAVSAADAEFYGLDQIGGALVAAVTMTDDRPSPAAEAGIETGDVIIGVAGEPVATVSDLQRRIRAYRPGQSVDLDIVKRRGCEGSGDCPRETVRITLAAAEEAMPEAVAAVADSENVDLLGVEVVELSPEFRSTFQLGDDVAGVVVRSVAQRGPFDRSFAPNADPRGLIIQDVNGMTIRTPQDFQQAMSQVEPGDVVSLLCLVPTSQTNLVVSVPIPNR
jgi:serine protease Do